MTNRSEENKSKELQEKLKTAETEKGGLETKLAEVLASVETLNKRIKDIESDKDVYQTQITELTAEKENLTKKIADHQVEIISNREAFEAEINQKKEEVARLEKDIEH